MSVLATSLQAPHIVTPIAAGRREFTRPLTVPGDAEVSHALVVQGDAFGVIVPGLGSAS